MLARVKIFSHVGPEDLLVHVPGHHGGGGEHGGVGGRHNGGANGPQPEEGHPGRCQVLQAVGKNVGVLFLRRHVAQPRGLPVGGLGYPAKQHRRHRHQQGDGAAAVGVPAGALGALAVGT